MTLKKFASSYLIKIIAIICLFLGLREAAQVLSVSSIQTSPIESLGSVGFFLFLGFVIFRLVSSVGMWIEAKWGAPLALVIIFLEFLLLIFSYSNFHISTIGIWIRAGLAIALLLFFLNAYISWRNSIHD